MKVFEGNRVKVTVDIEAGKFEEKTKASSGATSVLSEQVITEGERCDLCASRTQFV